MYNKKDYGLRLFCSRRAKRDFDSRIKMGRLGRKKKAVGEGKERVTAVRLTLPEREIVEQKAAAAGVTVSEWVRSAALEREPPTRRMIPEINRVAWLELAKLAAALNEATWQFKAEAEPETRRLFETMRCELARFRNTLIGNLEEGEK